MAPRIKLGELLVRAGVLDDFKLKAALAEQQRWGGRLGKILVEMNFVSEDLLVRALSKQLGIQRANLETANVPQEILSKIDSQFAVNNAICPERYIADKKTLIVAMADPTNVGAVDELRFKTGLRIETALAGELQITQAIDRIFYNRAPIEGIELMEIERRATSESGFQPLPPAYFDQNVPAPPPPSPAPQMPPTLNQLLAQPAFPGAPAPAPPQPFFSQPPNAHGGPNNVHAGTLPPFRTSPPMQNVQPLMPPVPPPPAAMPQMPQMQQGSQIPQMAQMPQTASNAALEMAVALDGAQKKQLKAIRVMLELLIEKGVFSRDEYMDLVNKR